MEKASWALEKVVPRDNQVLQLAGVNRLSRLEAIRRLCDMRQLDEGARGSGLEGVW